MTQFSLTEIDALAAKAARGAGYSWGMAEEAGIATRWLQAKGLPGTTLLLAHLTNMGGTNWPTIAPQIHANTWTTATGTPLCPLATGATLCDHAALITLPLTFTSIATPALLLPFAASLSKILATPLRHPGRARCHNGSTARTPRGAPVGGVACRTATPG